MNKPLGGRGQTAPYETKIVRVPIPVLPKVEQIIDDYRDFAINGEVSKSKINSESPNFITPVNYSEAVQHAREIIKTKKSATDSLAKLLQVLYGGTVSKADLR